MLKSTYEAPAEPLPLPGQWSQHEAPDGKQVDGALANAKLILRFERLSVSAQDDNITTMTPPNNLHIYDPPKYLTNP